MHFVTNLFPVMGVQNLSKSVLRFANRVIDKSLPPPFLCSTVYTAATAATAAATIYVLLSTKCVDIQPRFCKPTTGCYNLTWRFLSEMDIAITCHFVTVCHVTEQLTMASYVSRLCVVGRWWRHDVDVTCQLPATETLLAFHMSP